MIKNELVLILGQKRMGKTTLAFDKVRGRRYIFVDPKGQLVQNDLVEGKWRTMLPYKELQTFFDGKISSLSIWAPVNVYDSLFSLLRNAVHQQKKLDFWLVIDEAQFFADRYNMNADLRELVAHGGHSELNLIFIVREAQEISKFLRSQADEIISFRQVEPASLKWCSHLSAEAAVKLPLLKRFEYLYLRKIED